MTAATFRASMLGVGGEVEVSRAARHETSPALPLDTALADACAAALDREAGLVLTVDELQLAARTELSDLAATLQQHVPDHWPFVVVLAGLPSIRDSQRGVTYLERAEWHLVGLLDATATRFALRSTDASRREQDYLRHLAALDAGQPRVTGAMVAAAMATSSKSLSVPRNRLIQKGLIYAEGEAVRFSIPGMASWVRGDDPVAT